MDDGCRGGGERERMWDGGTVRGGLRRGNGRKTPTNWVGGC